MDSISCTGINFYNKTPSQEEKRLPHEIIQKISVYFNQMDMQQASSINYDWNSSMAAIADEKVLEIQHFANFLFSCLDKKSYPREKAALFDISNEEINSCSANLIEAKKTINRYQEVILNSLKNLSVNDLKHLEASHQDDPRPMFFTDMFGLVWIYKNIDLANQMPDGIFKCAEQASICNDLQFRENSSIGKAAEHGSEVYRKYGNPLPFQFFCINLFKKGCVNKTLEIINRALDEDKRQKIFEKIFDCFFWKGHNAQKTFTSTKILFDRISSTPNPIHNTAAYLKFSRAIEDFDKLITKNSEQDVFNALMKAENGTIFLDLIKKGNQDLFQFMHDIHFALMDISITLENLTSFLLPELPIKR